MKNIIVVLFLFQAAFAFGTNLKIENIELQVSRDSTITPKVRMNISWDNAWHNQKNNDAIWIFIKLQTDNGYRQAYIAPSGHSISYNPQNIKAHFETAENQAGIFISPDQNYRGNIQWTVEIELDRKTFERIEIRRVRCKAFGIEMVHVPGGAFTLGDPSQKALDHFAFYESKGDGTFGNLLELQNENQIIEVGPEEGKLYYQSNTIEYNGDQKGTIPSDFPKGVQAFYCMKYELKQGQYADFLNSINIYATHFRANFGGKDYYNNRGSIVFDRKKEIYYAEHPDRPCNYITWDDAMAYADWAGLRPMTEFEFTKACRGPEKPIEGEYPWGTNSKSQIQRGVNLDDDLIMFNGMKENELTDGNRDLYGASYFWVMDMAGSLWEKVVTVGDEKGRAFKGEHGDGLIDWSGSANEESWPKGMDEGGYGYRGGGFYYQGQNYHGFNPQSPIAYRPYGAWAGGNRSIAYSTRFVHTAQK